jgi:hypothetical protein
MLSRETHFTDHEYLMLLQSLRSLEGPTEYEAVCHVHLTLRALGAHPGN